MTIDEVVNKMIKRAIILPDIHVPFHDEETIKAVLRCIKELEPDRIIQLGDLFDFYDVSKFDKDPGRINSLQKEIDIGYELMEKVIKASPKSRVEYMAGNHERRLTRYLMRNPELHSLRSLKLENVTGFKDLGVRVYGERETCHINNRLIVTHGDAFDGCRLSQYSAYSAKSTLAKKGISGISGHSHRLGSHYFTNMSGTKEWHEAGILSQLDPEYMTHPDWQQGFVIVTYDNKWYQIDLIHIRDHRFIYDGILYTPEGRNKIDAKHGKKRRS